MTSRRLSALAALLCSVLACGQPDGARPASSAPGATLQPSAPRASGSSPTTPASAAAPRAAPGLSDEGFAKLVDAIPEPDADFFSDNYISNETSYLQIAGGLEARAGKGGTYVGVGPEQNFTYIALSRPEVAYVVDIRRDNVVLHLFYRALFEAASSRAHFLALLTGRPYGGDAGLPADASFEQVVAQAERDKATEASFESIHEDIKKRIEKRYHALDDKDARSLLRTHRAFFEDGLDIRFKLKEASFRKYPTLRELLAFEDPAGQRRGFLTSEPAFRFVQQMERENRIVPLVGDFAGDKAMPALAAHMKEAGETLRTFYVSNVEQYLLEDGKWWKWQRNVAAFPSVPESIFVRCYLDQGKPHPQQMKGHRTATTLQLIADFNAHKAPYPSLLALASDRTLPAE